MSLEISGRVINQAALSKLIESYARKAGREIDEVARDQAGELRNDIVALTPIDQIRLRPAWQGPIKISDGVYHIRNEMPYAVTVEYGGYPGVGPKTHKLGPRRCRVVS